MAAMDGDEDKVAALRAAAAAARWKPQDADNLSDSNASSKLDEIMSVTGLAASSSDKSTNANTAFLDSLAKKFLLPKTDLKGGMLGTTQVHWERKPDLASMLTLKPCDAPTRFVLDYGGLDGEVVGLKEVSARQTRTTVRLAANAAPATDGGSAQDSSSRPRSTGGITSITRSSGAQTATPSFVRGKIGQNMFVPGGLESDVVDWEHLATDGDDDDEVEQDEKRAIDAEVAAIEAEISKGVGLSTQAPGLPRGYRRGGGPLVTQKENCSTLSSEEEKQFVGIEIGDVASGLQDRRREHGRQLDPKERAAIDSAPNGHASDQVDEIDELLPVQKLSTAPRQPRGDLDERREWAHVVDVNRKITNFSELVPDMAHQYPFELDNFQKEAVYHLEQGENVFVAAHTSAGKTVVAEYAIALAQKHMTRCIYTSPIKALSNQKFREFKQTFGAQNVGILTGDVQINPEAPCLIMTTEILRSMLYRGADLIRDVEFVIFDEVHYVNDQERGVVWEEVIILCPQHINLILLSATVPNTQEFAGWVGRTKKKDIYVISTAKRPVPLEHFLYAGKELFKIVDAKGQMLGQGIKDAGEAIRRRQDKEREANGIPPLGSASRGRGGAAHRGQQRGSTTRGRGAPPQRGRGGGGNFSGGGQSGRGDKSIWVHLIGMLKKKELLPVVTFVFSKKRCEQNASSLPNTDLCTAREKSEVHVVIERSLTRLKGSDKNLPQIGRMRELLGRGIGVHHGGLLPIVKEVVEILFQRGLVKVLFSTETFAMGVNMPARSVVFSGIRKHDGRTFRDLLAGEYTQMSGRAGRRGLDATGVVIINAADELPETGVLNKMLLGQPTKLTSQFRLTYNMILNLLRVEALKVEEMIKRSFSENAAQRLLPDQQKRVKEIEKRLSMLPAMPSEERASRLETYYDLSQSTAKLNVDIHQLALGQAQGSKNFSPGRVVLLYDQHFSAYTPAVIVRQVSADEFLILAATTQDRKSGKLDSKFETVAPLWPPSIQKYPVEDLTYDLREVHLSSLARLTDQSIKIEQSMIMALRISAMQRTVEAMIPCIQALSRTGEAREVDWSKVRNMEFQELLRSREKHAKHVEAFLVGEAGEVLRAPSFAKEYSMMHQRKLLLGEISRLQRSISDENLELLPDYHQRIEVLKRLHFIDSQHENVLLKGRVACEINSVDELVTTELILDNFWTQYEAEEVVGLLSCLVFKEKADGEVELQGRLADGYAAILQTAERISAVQAQCQLNHEDYEQSLKTQMVPVAYAWAKGTPFAEICEMTDIAEGTIVRVITRLDETCRELRDAARVIGDADLWTKMERCMELIRRDIVFAASLYF